MEGWLKVHDCRRLSLFFLLGSLPVLLGFDRCGFVVEELASWAIWAVEILVESLALLGFIILV